MPLHYGMVQIPHRIVQLQEGTIMLEFYTADEFAKRLRISTDSLRHHKARILRPAWTTAKPGKTGPVMRGWFGEDHVALAMCFLAQSITDDEAVLELHRRIARLALPRENA